MIPTPNARSTTTPSFSILPKSPISVIQIDLRHSKLASASLGQVLLDLNIDIALILILPLNLNEQWLPKKKENNTNGI